MRHRPRASSHSRGLRRLRGAAPVRRGPAAPRAAAPSPGSRGRGRCPGPSRRAGPPGSRTGSSWTLPWAPMIRLCGGSRNNAPMNRILLALALAALLAGCATRFDLEGHRGTRGLAPENTLPAFAKALEIDVDTLELDTNVTRDGVVVISHNTSLNPDITRGPDGRWIAKAGPPIHALTFEELSRYDVGRIDPAAKYAKQFPDQVPVDGTHMPRLADLFAMVRRAGNRRV